MSETNDETNKRLADVEASTAWLKDRVWNGVGNLHDRIHTLEDRSADRSFELDKIKGDVQNIKKVIGLEEYGGRNLMTDLRDVADKVDDVNESMGRLKDNLITTKDFQTLLQKVDVLEKRGQAQISFWNFIQFGIIGAVISLLFEVLKARLSIP